MAQLPENTIEIVPASSPVDFRITPPGSKSVTNRALICASCATGQSELTGVLDSEDTRVMIRCLQSLGVQVNHDSSAETATITGLSGQFATEATDLFVANSGTTIRFLTALLGVHGGHFELFGIERMHRRPIGDLVAALNELGGNVSVQSPDQCPPVVIDHSHLTESNVKISGATSSQYLSGLMMAAPLAKNGLQIEIDGHLVSKPYVEMTAKVMKSFGVTATLDSQQNIVTIPGNQNYQAIQYSIEPDASAASYFWAAAAICGGSAKVEGLNQSSLQGDVKFVECLRAMGCKVNYDLDGISVSGPAKIGIDVDMSDISDTVQSLAAVALFVEGPTTVTGVAHNRVKETDRIGDLACELRKVDATVEERADGLTIHPPKTTRSATFETYNDHRMAMSLSLIGLKQPGIIIKNPECTAKTYPQFFEDLNNVIGSHRE